MAQNKQPKIKRITETLESFVTSDGDEYTSEEAAIEHELFIKFNKWYGNNKLTLPIAGGELPISSQKAFHYFKENVEEIYNLIYSEVVIVNGR